MIPLICVLALVFSPPAASPAFRAAVPGYHWRFPADDFAHAAFANEWWYFTGNLQADDGRRFGFELTFFRISPAPGTDLQHDLYFTHFAISDITGGHYLAQERARRGDWSQAGIIRSGTGFELWNENWRADFDASGPRALHAIWDGQSLDLALTPGARTLNGVNGWSQKGSAPGQASYYYSFPHVAAAGTIQKTHVTGLVWMDHEFASNQLASNQQGWDWMGLHLHGALHGASSGADLMLFNLRHTDGSRDPHSAGTIQPQGGTAVPLRAGQFQMTPLRWWHGYPVAWRVQIPSRSLDLTVNAELDDQEFRAPAAGVNYWEGAVSVSSTRGGTPVSGEGYLELTGYGRRFDLLQSP